MCVLGFSETFFIIRKVEREWIKNILTIVVSNSRFYCQIYAKIEFSCQMFEKYSSTNFHEIPSIGTRTDRLDETNSRFSQIDATNKEPFYVQF